MNVENPTYAFTGALVAELGRAGVRHAVICPGSRSTPIALSFADQKVVRVWMLIDERSAAFFALGLAKASNRAVALVCTSGTAAANFLPAIAEAQLSRVPLVVLTADRPPELRDNGAPQAMDQLRLYGSHTKWFAELALPEATPSLLRYVRTIANRAVATAIAAPAGPVQINMPLREPLTPAAQPDHPLPVLRPPLAWQGRDAEQPFVRVSSGSLRLTHGQITALADQLRAAERPLIIVGPQSDSLLAEPLTALAAALNAPILADPLGQLRYGSHDHSLIVDSYDAFLRDEGFAQAAAPDLVLRIGAMPTSKPLLLFLQAHADCELLVIDDGAGWRDPLMQAAAMIHATPTTLIEDLLPLLPPATARSGWASLWQQTACLARTTLETTLRSFVPMFEGRLWNELATLLPAETALVVGNSMPIRDCDTFLGGREAALRVLGNRGANGIDGLISTALGVAAAGERVVLVVGDLTFYHDLNGLLAAKLHALNATIIVINNDGGGIFSFLPQAAYPDHFEALFGTPHGLDFAPVVQMYGGHFVRAVDWPSFGQALSTSLGSAGLTVIEVPTERNANVTLHRQLWHAVQAALAASRAGGEW